MARTVLVTGANSGIGLATVLELAKHDFRVVGTARSDAKAAVIADAAAAAGVTVETVDLDVTDAERCAAVVDELGPLFGLVNNAGYSLTGAIEDVGDDEAGQLMETMVMAPARLSRLALPGMRSLGGGRIVNISSIYGKTTTPLTGWYQAAKHALEGLSDALRIETAQDGIKVVLVEPGGFKTNIWEDLERDLARRKGSRYEDAYQRIGTVMNAWSPLMGDPQQCAAVISKVVRAANPKARYLVGIDARLLDATSQLTPTPIRDRVLRFTQGL